MKGRATVVDEGGHKGRLLTDVSTGGHEGTVTIALDERRQVVVPTECLAFENDLVRLEGQFSDFDVLEGEAHTAPPATQKGSDGTDGDASRTLTAGREEVSVEKRRRPTGRVHVRKRIEEDQVEINEELEFDEVDIERIRVDRVVDRPPAIRREDDTLIVPLCEERIVKQTVVVEEVHIKRRHKSEQMSQRVPVRREVIDVERERLDSDNEREDRPWQNRPS